MSSKRPLEYWKKRNELLPCKAPGCTEPRFRVGGYCQNHANNHQRYGHWNHRRIMRWYYVDELADVRSIIDKNLAQEHPGILYAIKWLDLVLLGSVTLDGAFQLTDDNLSRLYDSGITGYDVLVEAAAVYRLYERGHPKRIFSHRHLLYMLGHRVCLLKAVAGHQGITGRADRVIGTAINKKVGVLLRLISRAIDDREEAQQRELSVLYEPLEL